MNRLVIVGASGHGKVVADIARLCGYDDIVFLDDDENKKECAGYHVVGKTNDAPAGDLFVAIGDNEIRKRICQQYADRRQPILIHPSAVVADNAQIGSGTVIMAGAVINPGASVGCGCIINTCSSVDHDCAVGDYVHISVGSRVCGTVMIGEMTWIGAGSTVINNISICEKCIIGAGAVVVKDIKDRGTFVGIPARRCK